MLGRRPRLGGQSVERLQDAALVRVRLVGRVATPQADPPDVVPEGPAVLGGPGLRRRRADGDRPLEASLSSSRISRPRIASESSFAATRASASALWTRRSAGSSARAGDATAGPPSAARSTRAALPRPRARARAIQAIVATAATSRTTNTANGPHWAATHAGCSKAASRSASCRTWSRSRTMTTSVATSRPTCPQVTRTVSFAPRARRARPAAATPRMIPSARSPIAQASPPTRRMRVGLGCESRNSIPTKTFAAVATPKTVVPRRIAQAASCGSRARRRTP